EVAHHVLVEGTQGPSDLAVFLLEVVAGQMNAKRGFPQAAASNQAIEGRDSGSCRFRGDARTAAWAVPRWRSLVV
ncbi:MAG: hypothetical protein ACYTFN_08055, partial [Planctomycetota bacterium]